MNIDSVNANSGAAVTSEVRETRPREEEKTEDNSKEVASNDEAREATRDAAANEGRGAETLAKA